MGVSPSVGRNRRKDGTTYRIYTVRTPYRSVLVSYGFPFLLVLGYTWVSVFYYRTLPPSLSSPHTIKGEDESGLPPWRGPERELGKVQGRGEGGGNR